MIAAASIDRVETRRAQPADADAIALAHLDSIRSIGARFYPPGIVDDWQEGITAALYINAMEGGEVFFIATGVVDGQELVLGFSSDYPLDGARHGTSVYVRGAAARQGIGSKLLLLAESHAREAGAASIHIDASLAGLPFYRAHGFVETGRRDVRLATGKLIACVCMRKDLIQA
jgi:ribosomal protein S18 acetylase RimI-like enzyme